MNVETLFHAARGLSAADRDRFLAANCPDPEIRQQVQELLASGAAAGDFLETPATGMTASTPDLPAPSDRIGPYKLLQRLGEGGMGDVWLAEQSAPVQRKVALKVIKPGLDSRQVIARFEAERQALALMEHPNIAKVFDAGATDAGRPYFVMELVKGIPITKYCDLERLSPQERLELFIPVCQAVQHAHQKGIIHRDLKPSNVIVGLFDGKPVPKVIDFGVAKATAQKLTERTMFTEVGQIVGTLEYMAPEQAELNNLDIDTRADIYSLGVILYELLAGSPPFTAKQLRDAAFDEMLRIIREVEPPKPSTKLSSSEELPAIAAHRKLEPKKLTRLIHGDLDWIAMKCLEKDRGRRYETANGLAMDLHRYLADEAVLAGPPSRIYRFKKFLRRNRGRVLAAAVVLVALLGGIVGTTWGLVRADRARQAEAERAEGERAAKAIAQEREAETQAVLDFVQNKIFAAARPKDQVGGQGYDVKLADAVKAALAFVDKSFTGQPLIEARLRMTLGSSFYYLADIPTSIEQREKARDLYTKHRGPNHPDTLASMNNLANSYAEAGRTQEALKLREETLRLQKTTLGPDHPDTLVSMQNLANSYADAGRTQEALALNEETLRLRKAKLGPDNADTLWSMNNLANSYRAVGRAPEAVKLHEETLQRRKALVGPNHPDTLVSMNNLANAYSDAGRAEEALKLREETLQLKKTRFGPDHRETIISMSNLAYSYTDAGRFQEALKLNEETLRLSKLTLGPDHPSTLRSMNNLANSCIAVGDIVKAAAILQDTLILRERRMEIESGNSVEHARLAWTHGQIGEVAQARSDFVTAVQAYARCVEMFDKLDQARTLKDPALRARAEFYRRRLALCRKAEQAIKDLDFALQQPAAEVPELLDLRVRFLLKEGMLPAAVESAVKMTELAGDNAEPLYAAARANALSAGAAKKRGEDATPLAKQCADEAVRVLKQAIRNGYKNAASVKQERDLDAIREREDFKNVLAELAGKNP
jgi:serine/threonine protein kinase